MKTRLITSVVCIALLCAVLTFFDTIYFNLVCAVFALLAIKEIISAIKPAKPLAVFFPYFPVALIVMLSPYYSTHRFVWPAIIFLFAYNAFLLVVCFEKMEFTKLASVAFFSGVVLVGLYTPVYLKILFPTNLYQFDALFYFILSLCIAFGGDTFAYLIGVTFGKHRLAPLVSPHKSIEGAFGGILGSVFIGLVALWGYINLAPIFAQDMSVSVNALGYVGVAALSAVASVLGILGDLFASAIKRQSGIKDYGALFPGHGGVMDRFDSALFVLPFVAFATYTLPIIVR